ncbi:MAG TPA: hypothetical protein PLA74_04535 [Syntrophales bacterium]|nr:hypothetical protein [Syntrophales bacterium]
MSPVTFLRYFAPLFFILCAGLRCYLETGVFGKAELFSYYTLLHHVLWYLSAMLGAMLTLHLILKAEFRDLNWLFYGAVLFFIPVLYAHLTGQPLQLKYLDPDVLDIVKNSLSACLLHPKNKPQFLEIILIDTGVFVYSFFLTRNVKKAIIATLALHVVLTLFGIKWFYSREGSAGVIRISTRLPNHVWMSLIWLGCSTFLTQVMLFKSGLYKKVKKAGTAVITGSLTWIAAFTALTVLQGSITFFDAAAVTMPLYLVVVIAMIYVRSEGVKIPVPLRAVLMATLGVQLMSIIPILFNIQKALLSKAVVVPF